MRHSPGVAVTSTGRGKEKMCRYQGRQARFAPRPRSSCPMRCIWSLSVSREKREGTLLSTLFRSSRKRNKAQHKKHLIHSYQSTPRHAGRTRKTKKSFPIVNFTVYGNKRRAEPSCPFSQQVIKYTLSYVKFIGYAYTLYIAYMHS